MLTFGDTWVLPDTNPTGCSPADCLGCCLGGACMPGNETQACGTGGVLCAVCQSGEGCQGGSCVPEACGPTTCPGCCDSSGQCQSGGTEAACGSGGADCAACTGTDLCIQGGCQPKPASSYKVILVSAATSKSVLYCDITSKCDPFIVVTISGIDYTSTIIKNNHAPVWNEHLATASAADLLAQFQVKIYDDNLVGKNLLSQCGVALTSADLSAGTYSHTCGDWNPVVWKFTPP
jgi:hypothetical protein